MFTLLCGPVIRDDIISFHSDSLNALICSASLCILCICYYYLLKCPGKERIGSASLDFCGAAKAAEPAADPLELLPAEGQTTYVALGESREAVFYLNGLRRHSVGCHVFKISTSTFIVKRSQYWV